MSRQPIELLHIAFTDYPADTRVKREADAVRAIGRRVAVLALRSSGQHAVERRAGILVIRVRGRKQRGGFLSYLMDYVAFVWRARWLVARHRRLRHVRILHIHTLPDFLILAALPARRWGARIVFDMHEIFPEFARTKFSGFGGHLVSWLALLIERWARTQADLTITVNRPIDALLARRPIRKPEQRLVVHNTADPADFGEPSPGRQLMIDHGSPLELVYHGTLTALYGLDIAIRGVALARRQGIGVRLSIIGDGPERESLSILATQLDAQSVRFESPVPQSALPKRLGRCDAGVIPTRLDDMTRYSLSNKLLEYVHLGIPLIAARLPSYEAYIPEDAAWFWKPGDPEDFAHVIVDFANSDLVTRSNRVTRAREACASFAWPRERERLRAAYTALLQDIC